MGEEQFVPAPWDKDAEYLKEEYSERVTSSVNATSNDEERLFNIKLWELVWEMETSFLDTTIDFLISVADARTVTERYVDSD